MPVEIWYSSTPIDQPTHWDDTWSTADVARSVDALIRGRDPLSSLIARLLDGKRAGIALDHGCGFGRVSAGLHEFGWKAVGVDFATDSLALAAANKAAALAGDIRALPFADRSFDAAVSIGVVEHLREGPDAALLELHRVLRAKAVALITVPYYNPVRRWRGAVRSVHESHGYLSRRAQNNDAVSDEPGFYQYVYTPKDFARRLSAAGLRVQWRVPHSVMHGIADLHLGAATKRYLHTRLGATTLERGAAHPAATGLVGRLSSYLRTAYNETDTTLLARAFRYGIGPAFGHMMAYGVVRA